MLQARDVGRNFWRCEQEAQGFNDPTAAVVYVRVSSDRQIENTSLDGQRRACKDFCHKHGGR
jgi:hypothetical protein